MPVGVQKPETASDSQQCEFLTDDLGWLLGQTKHALATEISAALEPLGISLRGHWVLTAAMEAEHTQRELAHAIGLDKTTMVVTVDELEAAGLAERRPLAQDRRARVIAVTKAGERKVAEAQAVIDRVQTDVFDSLPAGERKVLVGALNRLITGRLSEPVVCNPPLRRREP